MNGQRAEPLFIFLKGKSPALLGTKIKWNYTKALDSLAHPRSPSLSVYLAFGGTTSRRPTSSRRRLSSSRSFSLYASLAAIFGSVLAR